MYKRTHKNLLAILLSLFFMFSMVPGSILHATDDDQIANPENQQAEAEAAGADNDPIAPEAEEEVGTESTGEVKSDYENKFIFRFDGREIDSQMAKDGQVLSRPQTEEYEKQGYFVEGWYLADEAGNYLASFDFEQTLNTQTSGQTYYIDLDYLIFNVYYIFLVETEDTELDNLEAFYSEAFTNKDGLSYLEKPNLFALNQEGMSVETWLVQNDAGEWVEFDFNNPIKVSEADKEFVIKGVISKIPDSSTRNIINPKPYHEYTFMLDGEVYDDGNEYNNPQIIKDGESLVEPRVPEKEDKVFLGWYKDLNDESTRIDFSQTITVQDTQEIKLHAKFGDAIKVYFKSEGAVIASKDVAPRETVDDSNVPLVILAEGKVFSHWSLEENGEEYDFNTPVEKTITLYAVLVDGHKVSFRAHGGSAHNMIMVKHNETLEGKVTNPTRPGYAFEHWSLEENGTEYDLTSPITKDIVLHAVWTAAGNTNYTVVHWQEKANSDDYEYVEQEVLTGVTGQTAGFSPKTYSGFKYNEAKSDSEKIIDGYGSTVVNVYYDRDRYTLEFWSLKQPIILYKPDKRLFTFPDIKWGADTSEWWDQAVAKYPTYSWGEKSNGEGPWYSLPPEMPQKDLTVYGRAKGSTLHANIYIEKASGKEIREAYEFYQGSIFSTQEDYVDIEGFTCIHPKEYGETWTWNSITKRYELKFYYSRNEYKITFHNDKDGANQIFSNIAFEADISGKAPADHVFGETIREADGYVFAGWFDNEGLAGEPFDFNGKTMPANNLAFYAKWAPPVHEVRAHKGIAMDEFPLQFIVDHDGKLTGDQKADMDNLKDNNVPSGQTLDDFAGWFYYLGDKFTRFDFDTPIISDLDLHAVWARDLVTITYPISAEGTETESYVKGTAAKMPKGFSCGDGKVFLGWQIKDANGQVAEKVYQPGETIVVNENIELVRVCGDPDTAITLTYNGNGGAMEGGATTHSVNLANNALVKLTNPGFTRPGYKFTGWNTEEDGTGMEFTAEMTVMVDRLNEETANILYAQWKEITIKLTVQKVWEGGTKPATTLNLKRKVGEEVDEDFVQSFTTMEGADYSNELEVTKNNASGESYTYYLEEPTVPENYIATFSEDGLTVTNTYESPKSILESTKTWDLSGYMVAADEYPSVTFELYRKVEGEAEEKVKDATALSENKVNWGEQPTHRLSDGKEYTYFIKEKVEGFGSDNWTEAVEGLNATNTLRNAADMGLSLKVTKVLQTEIKSRSPQVFKVKVTGPYGYSVEKEIKAGEKVTFDGLHNGTYTVVETDAQGYEVSYQIGETVTSDKAVVEIAEGEGFTAPVVTVTNQRKGGDQDPNSVSVTVKKVWEGGTKPATKLNLKRKVGDTVDAGFNQSFTTTAGANFTEEVKNLPKYNNEGNPYTYYVEEPEVPENYEKTEDGLTVTNTYKSPVKELESKKTWNLSGYTVAAGEYPTVKFELYRKVEGEEAEEKVVDATALIDNKVNWGEQPTHRQSDGKEYTYFIKETVEGFGADNWTQVVEGLNATNTLTNAADMELSLEVKVLIDTTIMSRSQQLFKVKVTGPYGYEKEIEDIRAGETVKFDGLHNGTYKVEETDTQGYVAFYQLDAGEITKESPEVKIEESEDFTPPLVNIINRRTGDEGDPNSVDITVRKVWKGGRKPDTVIELWRKGLNTEGEEYHEKADIDGGQFTANADTTSHIFKGLAKHDPSGREFEYYAKEPTVPENYTATFSEDKLTVTNTYTIPTNGSITVEKVWEGDENVTRPTLNFTLYRKVEGGAEEIVNDVEGNPLTAEITGTETTASWTGLEKTDINGNKYIYSVKETVAQSDPLDENWVFGEMETPEAGNPFIKNRVISENPENPEDPENPNEKLAKLTIKKVFKNEPNLPAVAMLREAKEPIAFTFKVTGPYGYEKEVILKAGEEVTLDKLYYGEYKVEETVTHGYTPSYDKESVALTKAAPEGTITVTNTNEPDDPNVPGVDPNPNILDLTVSKEWVNGPKPDTVIELWRKGQELDGTAIDEKVAVDDGQFTANADTTSHTFEGLAKHDPSGREFEYYAKEPTVPENYTSVVEGLTVTNTYSIPTNGSITVEKVWEGDENVTRPTLNFTLYRKVEGGAEEAVSGAEVKEITAAITTASWTGLEETDINGNKYIYSVKETVAQSDPLDENWVFGEMETPEAGNPFIKNRVISENPENPEDPENPNEKLAKLTIKKVFKNEPNVAEVSMLREAKEPIAFTFKVTGPYGYEKEVILKAGEEVTLDKLYYGEYKVEETVTHGYTPSYDKESVALTKAAPEGTITVTNTNEPDDPNVPGVDPNPNILDITVNKVWVNGPKPDTVIELWRKGQEAQVKNEDGTYTDGAAIDEKVGEFTANAKTTSHTFEGLAKHDPSGREFEYYAKEPTVPYGYEMSVSEDGLTITNRYTVSPTPPPEPSGSDTFIIYHPVLPWRPGQQTVDVGVSRLPSQGIPATGEASGQIYSFAALLLVLAAALLALRKRR